jgi:hypothetical protein
MREPQPSRRKTDNTMKLKVLSVSLCVLALSTAVMAADMSEAQFKNWMSSITLDGLKFYEIEKDGSKLQASFVNPAAPHIGPRMVVMSPLPEFLDYQKMLDNPSMRMGPTQGFTYKGLRVVVVDTQSEIGMLVAVEAKAINKTITVSFPSKTAQASIEAGLGRIGIADKK